PELRASNVVVTNASGVHTIPMAEHILGTLVALARHFPAAVRYQLERRWAQQEIWDVPQRPRELAGQTLLIIGFGAIGREVARGSLVDEAALTEALQRRAIAGAALDVADREPLPPESPLWGLENVFITPHISAASEYLWDRQTELLLENLERWFSGRELLNQ